MARDVAGVLSGKIVPLRSPDAAQCAADPGSIDWSGVLVGPGSAVQRYTLYRVRDTKRRESYPPIRPRPVQNPAFSTFLSTLPTPGHRQLRDEFDVLWRVRRTFFALTRLIRSSAF